MAASNLGVRLDRRGDLAEAEAAYRRADVRGDANGAFNLAGLLAEPGESAGAEAGYRRADERGDAGAAGNLGLLLERRRNWPVRRLPTAAPATAAMPPVCSTTGCCSKNRVSSTPH